MITAHYGNAGIKYYPGSLTYSFVWRVRHGGIGLMLFVLWDVDLNAVWMMNIGLLLIVVISVLPVDLAQTVASVKHGLWYARSSEFLESPTLKPYVGYVPSAIPFLP